MYTISDVDQRCKSIAEMNIYPVKYVAKISQRQTK